jgi:prespore-specific regulator
MYEESGGDVMETVERWTTRSDAWTAEDDLKLAEIVLRHIRDGSTQLNAFVEAANLLGRTPAACGYRWNGVVRKHYEEAIRQAKKTKKERTALRQPGKRRPLDRTEEGWSLESIIAALRNFDRFCTDLVEQNRQLVSTIEEMKRKMEELTEENRILRESNGVGPLQLAEDSKVLLAIMERAKKLLEREERDRKPRFPLEKRDDWEDVTE